MNETINYLERVLYRCQDDRQWEAYNLIWEMLCNLEEDVAGPSPEAEFINSDWDYPEDEWEDISPLRDHGPDYWQNDAGEWSCG